MSKIALLATGDEITNGDIINSNAHFLAHQLASNGLTVGLHMTCPDDESMLSQSMEFLLTNHDLLITIGGLGPTSDDKTRFSLGQCLNEELVFFEEAGKHVRQRLNSMKSQLTPSNKQQCLFPRSASLLDNPNGTALGCQLTHHNKTIFMLPGPPNECLPMFEQWVLPSLKASYTHDKQLLKWRLFGVSEGQVGEHLDAALEHLNCTTGYRWDYPYIEFKVCCSPALTDEVKTIIQPLVAPHLISPADKTASQVLRAYLIKSQQNVNIIDHATGGLLQYTLECPALHNTVYYNASQPTDIVITVSGLDSYWQQSLLGETSIQLTIDAKNSHYHENHRLPYRNNNIQQYATQFIAHKILEQLNTV